MSSVIYLLLILFGHVFDMNLLCFFFAFAFVHKSAFVQLIALHGHTCSRSLFLIERGISIWYIYMVYCAERFNCSISDLICGRLPIIINSHVRNSVDETTLDRVAFLHEGVYCDSGQFTYLIRLVI